jgi:hypothetical protein
MISENEKVLVKNIIDTILKKAEKSSKIRRSGSFGHEIRIVEHYFTNRI